MSDLENLKEEIEKIRHRLYQDISNNSKEEILKTSKELDEAIIKYLKNQLNRNKS
ncbi:Spo0E family sporulation regulatory protein-aspartic acid phosphatase [Schnuerera sp. xch1]|uniref:Spo0E family sporulation regulatory protein-aspartic acid phosphatase n=1 Tax=Schnuerera sp. xch1 TaxID=2874283 RepID=UPI001CBEA67E|nr:Spo0E family sporulation regulatory protein-aspartic acid phosphatase [Schnuerera sp. xch1]